MSSHSLALVLFVSLALPGCGGPAGERVSQDSIGQLNTIDSGTSLQQDQDGQSIPVQVQGLSDYSYTNLSLIWVGDDGQIEEEVIPLDSSGAAELTLPGDQAFLVLANTQNKYGHIEEDESSAAVFDGTTTPLSITLTVGVITLNGELVDEMSLPDGASATVSNWLKNLYKALATAGLCEVVEWCLETYWNYWCPDLSWYWDTLNAACGCCITFSTCAAPVY